MLCRLYWRKITGPQGNHPEACKQAIMIAAVDNLPPAEHADIETSGDEYAKRFSGPVGAWMLKVQEQIVLSMVDRLEPERILDVGGGHGQLAVPLCKADYPVTVLGTSELCQNRIAGVVESGQCEFIVGSLVDLPFEDRFFDVTICFRLVAHCQEWPLVIKEICRVSRETVIIDYPAKHSLNALGPLFFRAKKRLEKNTRPWTNFTHKRILDAFKEHGFSLKSREKEFFLPLVIHRMMRCRPCSTAVESLFKELAMTRLWGSPVIVQMDRSAAVETPGHEIRVAAGF